MHTWSIEQFNNREASVSHNLFSSLSLLDWLRWEPAIRPPLEGQIESDRELKLRRVLTVTRSDGSIVLKVDKKESSSLTASSSEDGQKARLLNEWEQNASH